MKYAVLIARLLFGLVFLVFGANHVVPFMPMPPMAGDAGTWSTIMFTHKYFAVIGLIEVISGLLLLVGRYVPLALTLAGPVVANIFLFAVLIQHSNPAIALVMVVLEAFLLFAYRLSFAGIFSAGPEVVGSPKL